MVTTGLKRILERRGFEKSPLFSVNNINTSGGRINWELYNYVSLEKILLKWHHALYVLSHSQVFTDAVYESFSGKMFTRRGLPPRRLSYIITIANNKYGDFLRRDISDSDSTLVKELIIDAFKGVKIGQNIIFPVIYYPYMDKQYFDHANWNKVPVYISISDVLHRKDKYLIYELKKVDIDPYSSLKKDKVKCSCSTSLLSENSSCSCKGDQNNFSNNPNDVINKFISLNQFSKFSQKPILYIGYGDLTGYGGYILIQQCRCHIRIGGATSYCSTNGDGQFCASVIPCPNVDCPSKGFDLAYDL